jgi:nucleotide-binding universal stress UspA family protein
MNTKMKILIAYDGSSCADAALDDLRRAGLPGEAVAVVLAVADVWLPPTPPSSEQRAKTALAERIVAAQEQARAQAVQAVEEVRLLAVRASDRVRAHFPTWEVRAEACADSPAWAVIKKVDEWKPDLVVVGSHGRSTLGRFLLGSVSQKVVTESHCTVHIARGGVAENTFPVRLVIGVDGSPDADAAVRTVAERVWPPGSEARLIAVLDQALATAVEWNETGDASAQAGARKIVEAAAETLRAAGLLVSSVVREGDPKRVLIEEAEQWSTAVAARSHCSVEVVHPRQIT